MIGDNKNFFLDIPQNSQVWRAAIFVISLLLFSCAWVGEIVGFEVVAVQIQILFCLGVDSLWCGWVLWEDFVFESQVSAHFSFSDDAVPVLLSLLLAFPFCCAV